MSAEEIDYLSVEDLLEIAAGVIDHMVVRDAGLLAAAAAPPQVTVVGDDAYPKFEDKAAALLHSLVRNHALVDGNRPFACSAARVFCRRQPCRVVGARPSSPEWGGIIPAVIQAETP